MNQRSTSQIKTHLLRHLLGLKRDAGYLQRRSSEKSEFIANMSGCGPIACDLNTLFPYLEESALRLLETGNWLDASRSQVQVQSKNPKLLEVGSNPYFMSISLKERFPNFDCLGVNYHAPSGENGVGQIFDQNIVDPKNRLALHRYLFADIERHALSRAATFDYLLFCEVIEHLPYDPSWALFNLASTLKTGGIAIITTPNPARMESIEKLALTQKSVSDPISGHGIHGRHNREYDFDELRDLLLNTGFEVLKHGTFDTQLNTYSRSAQEQGYGQYHFVMAILRSRPKIYRPDWLYRGYEPHELLQDIPLLRRSG